MNKDDIFEEIKSVLIFIGIIVFVCLILALFANELWTWMWNFNFKFWAFFGVKSKFLAAVLSIAMSVGLRFLKYLW